MSARSVQLLLGVTAACLLTHCHRIQAAEDDFGDDDDYGDKDDDREDDREYTPGGRKQSNGGLVDVRHNAFGEKHVGVHVPVFYKMNLDKDTYDGRKNLGIDVLKGLVKVRVNKDPYKIKDNVFVSVAGLPLWHQR